MALTPDERQDQQQKLQRQPEILAARVPLGVENFAKLVSPINQGIFMNYSSQITE